MPQSQRRIIRGATLLDLLAHTLVDVQLRGVENEYLGDLTSAQAHALVRADVEAFIGGGSTKRCRYVRALRPWVPEPVEPTLPPPLDDPHFWDDRSVTRWHTDCTACMPRKVKDQLRADHWDAMLLRADPPKSWRRIVRA